MSAEGIAYLEDHRDADGFIVLVHVITVTRFYDLVLALVRLNLDCVKFRLIGWPYHLQKELLKEATKHVTIDINDEHTQQILEWVSRAILSGQCVCRVLVRGNEITHEKAAQLSKVLAEANLAKMTRKDKEEKWICSLCHKEVLPGQSHIYWYHNKYQNRDETVFACINEKVVQDHDLDDLAAMHYKAKAKKEKAAPVDMGWMYDPKRADAIMRQRVLDHAKRMKRDERAAIAAIRAEERAAATKRKRAPKITERYPRVRLVLKPRPVERNPFIDSDNEEEDKDEKAYNKYWARRLEDERCGPELREPLASGATGDGADLSDGFSSDGSASPEEFASEESSEEEESEAADDDDD